MELTVTIPGKYVISISPATLVAAQIERSHRYVQVRTNLFWSSR